MNSLPPEEHDEDLRKSTPTNQTRPSRRMTWSMTQDTGLGQDPLLVNASSAPSLPQSIMRSTTQAMGAEHQLVSLFLISIE